MTDTERQVKLAEFKETIAQSRKTGGYSGIDGDWLVGEAYALSKQLLGHLKV